MFPRHQSSPNLVNLISGEEYSSDGFSSSFHPDFTGLTSEGHNNPAEDKNNNEDKEQAEGSSINLSSQVVMKEGNGTITKKYADGRIIERNYQWTEKVRPSSVEKPTMDFGGFQWRNQHQDSQSFHKPQYQYPNGQHRNDPNVNSEGHDKSKTSLMLCAPSSSAGYSNSSSCAGGFPVNMDFEVTNGSSSSEVWGHGGGHSASPTTHSLGDLQYRRRQCVRSEGSKDNGTKSEFQGSSFPSRWRDAEETPSTSIPKGSPIGISKGHSIGIPKASPTSTPKGPSVNPNRRPTKCEDEKKKAGRRITNNIKEMMVDFYRRNKHKDVYTEHFQTCLWLSIYAKHPEVTREDVKRWHDKWYMKLVQDASKYTSPVIPQGFKQASKSFPVKPEDRKERKMADSKVSHIKINTRSVFVRPTPSPKSLRDAKILEGQLVKHMNTYGQVKMHQYLPESCRFLITFAERFNATKAAYSWRKSECVDQYKIKISYAPPPSLFCAFQERNFDPTYGTSKISMRDVPLDLKLLKRECDVVVLE